ncbi:unnamed protein product [Mycena citricolor]|uniref:Uncharacterized protein n=1 Tax=Mycena citricolor TaxID=2018698 RepID=A0AAD2H463_9AGAR|nr:unnamed protein product [Mycena citricolor]
MHNCPFTGDARLFRPRTCSSKTYKSLIGTYRLPVASTGLADSSLAPTPSASSTHFSLESPQ